MKRILGGALALMMALPAMAAEKGEDGLYIEPWYRDTFKDLREDLDEANSDGKRLVLMVEQNGCIYCDKMHEEVFSDPAVKKLIEDNFFVVQLNLHGDIEVTDFDGEVLIEKAMVRKWGVLFTPTILFLPEQVSDGQSAQQAAVAAMPGAFGKGTTTDLFTWVVEKRYELDNGEDFQRYHARRIKERNNGATD